MVIDITKLFHHTWNIWPWDDFLGKWKDQMKQAQFKRKYPSDIPTPQILTPVAEICGHPSNRLDYGRAPSLTED